MLIAARVLHRESTMDPLLLTGVVRVALEKVAEGSATVLTTEIPGWVDAQTALFGVPVEMARRDGYYNMW